MIEVLTATVWAAFLGYTVWYFALAKHYAPLTLEEVQVLWKIHKQSAGCPSLKWKKITKGGKIVGFECDCGYRHIQKRPIVKGTPAPADAQTKITAIYKKLHGP
ncbi:MAG: hypothetical protein QXK93_03990 [Candidatus Bathyarchaeia archaeon]|nr:hypothetical protein [Candidatus Bathyarchaeota archaeon]